MNQTIDFHETILEKIFRWIKLPYPVVWFLLAVILFLLRNFILIFERVKDVYSYLNALLSLELFGLACGIIWTCRKLEALLPNMVVLLEIKSDNVEDWYKNKVKSIFNNVGMLITGLIFLIVFWPLFFIYLEWESWLVSKNVLYFDYVYHGMIMIVAGMSQFAFYRISGLFMGIDKLRLKSNIMHHKAEIITEVGKTLMQIGIMALSLLTLFSVIFYLSPLAKKYTNIISLLVIIFSVGTIFWFFITQWKFHKLLKNHKYKLINDISKHIDTALNKILGKPQTNIIRQVNELNFLLNQVRDIPEWSFNTRTLFSLLSTVVIPILAALIQLGFQ